MWGRKAGLGVVVVRNVGVDVQEASPPFLSGEDGEESTQAILKPVEGSPEN